MQIRVWGSGLGLGFRVQGHQALIRATFQPFAGWGQYPTDRDLDEISTHSIVNTSLGAAASMLGFFHHSECICFSFFSRLCCCHPFS